MSNSKRIDQVSRSETNRERFYSLPVFCLGFFLLFTILLFPPRPISASGLSSVNHKSINGFETVYSQTSRGLGFQIIGESLLIKKRVKRLSRVQLKVFAPVKKAFLIWSGEVIEHNKSVGKIHFLGPKNKEHRITAQRIWKKNSTGFLYSALADVTSYVTGSGSYGVKNLSSEVVNPGGRDPFSVAGWALFIVTEDRNSDEVHSVTFLAGLQVLKPGETYDLPLTPYLEKGFIDPSAIGIVGGHGRAGNGSGNLFNGRAISGEDDWDGSAGKFWDIDLYELRPDTNRKGDKDMTLTLDPLLQWLYPVGVVLKLRSHEKKE